jgi:hypothetical protein
VRGDAEHDARSAYADVLRAFAAEMPGGALTCTAYARARGRHPEWPTRNTITIARSGAGAPRCGQRGSFSCQLNREAHEIICYENV